MNTYVEGTGAPSADTACLSVESRRATGGGAPIRKTAARVGAMGAAAAVLGQLTHPDSTFVICPLRALTGVPCPLCGGTTAAASVGRLRLGDALLANPFVVLAAAAFALIPLIPLIPLPAAMPVRARAAASPYVRVVLLAAIVLTSELWQLGRFGFLS